MDACICLCEWVVFIWICTYVRMPYKFCISVIPKGSTSGTSRVHASTAVNTYNAIAKHLLCFKRRLTSITAWSHLPGARVNGNGMTSQRLERLPPGGLHLPPACSGLRFVNCKHNRSVYYNLLMLLECVCVCSVCNRNTVLKNIPNN